MSLPVGYSSLREAATPHNGVLEHHHRSQNADEQPRDLSQDAMDGVDAKPGRQCGKPARYNPHGGCGQGLALEVERRYDGPEYLVRSERYQMQRDRPPKGCYVTLIIANVARVDFTPLHLVPGADDLFLAKIMVPKDEKEAYSSQAELQYDLSAELACA
ncbi:hypothetical protein PG993_001053 [Apiospora rasikravindrae]|uniref:Uncharacterized protein n=1 Tax=Apiospora rasikravindrae TaxID=990691 RepID=A0ABR1UAB2_9PEZI